MSTLHAVANWLYHVLGLKGTGPWYSNWSGWFADLTIVSAGIAVYRKHNCHSPRCLRIGKHPAADGIYVLCWHHHPDFGGKRPTLEFMHAHHHRIGQGDDRAE